MEGEGSLGPLTTFDHKLVDKVGDAQMSALLRPGFTCATCGTAADGIRDKGNLRPASRDGQGNGPCAKS